ncbi:MAG: antibiotic biosynthesis monooxygenase [Bacteroidetes bacterium]|nr:MAG: antibiotic biosynthesis monooxygenase [Bacteroidota bacterium]
MIVRIWHGRTRAKDAVQYREYVVETGIHEYIHTEGNLGAQVWQRQDADITHIWTVSWWKDIESIQSFAGNNPLQAKYYEEDKKFLLEFEPEVMHCEAYNYGDFLGSEK